MLSHLKRSPPLLHQPVIRSWVWEANPLAAFMRLCAARVADLCLTPADQVDVHANCIEVAPRPPYTPSDTHVLVCFVCVMQFPIVRRLGEPAEVGTLQEYVAAMKPNQPGIFYEEGLKTLPCSKSWELLMWLSGGLS